MKVLMWACMTPRDEYFSDFTTSVQMMVWVNLNNKM